MKTTKLFFYAAALALLWLPVSCEKDPEEVKTFDVTVQLAYPDDFAPAEGVAVTLRNIGTGDVNVTNTNASGAATFTVVAGLYEATASDERSDEVYRYIINGANSIVITDTWTNGASVSLSLTVTPVAKPVEGDVSPHGKLIIKELYVGGCQPNSGTATFSRDAYLIIYNNSSQPAAIDNLAVGTCFPHNAHQASSPFWINGAWIYADEPWMPSVYGAWQITNKDTLQPGEQRVIVVYQAINHTLTYSNSVNLANAGYYVAYDPTVYNNTSYHIPPSELIPTAQYLKAYRLSGVTANAWTISQNSPALYLFAPRDGVSLSEFVNDPGNIVLHGTSATQAALKVPRTWILDAIEVFQEGNEANSKTRFTPDVNVGYIAYTNNHGHTLYRNVDKEATEAIIANKGKLVYGYSLGWGESTDPSGINAEASIRNGAHIIYKETNNTTQDFHQRGQASLRY